MEAQQVQTLISTIFGHISNFYSASQMKQMEEEHHKKQMELHEQTLSEVRQLRAKMDNNVTTSQPATVVLATPQVQTIAPPKVEPTKAPEKESYSQYLQEYGQSTVEDVSVGCVPCTRAHLSTMAGSLKQGDTATAREEITALLEYDLTDEKLAQTPAKDRQVLAKYAGKLDKLNNELQGPVPEITVASASLKESLRFARADGLDHPEVQVRVQRAEDAVNSLERATLSPERLAAMSPEERERAKKALPQLREARQQLINNVHNVDDLEDVTVKLASIDKELNPPPSGQKMQALQQEADQLNTEFRRDVLKSWKGGK